MKREQFFSKGGYYPFIVETDILLHSEAITLGRQVLSNWLLQSGADRTIRVLDLACGGMPIAICDIMSHFPDVEFTYTGIDINPDQIALAREFQGYSSNVKTVTLLEGNAWHFDALDLNGPFDVIFSGMNLHHGTVDELYFLALELDRVLAQGGFIFSHDVYRPVETQYIERPAYHQSSFNEPLQLIEERALAQLDIPSFDISKVVFGQQASDWREVFIEHLTQYLDDHNARPDYIQQTREHVYQRDFAVSIPEMKKVFAAANFSITNVTPNNLEHPLAPYYAFLLMQKSEHNQ